MDDISLYISKDTIEKKKYLTDFFKRIEVLKVGNKHIDAYKIGMNEEPKFWSELYDDYPLPEEKCDRKYIRVGAEYQAKI
jgi:hypothetical protein